MIDVRAAKKGAEQRSGTMGALNNCKLEKGRDTISPAYFTLSRGS
jgi:hypothetical protein